MFSLSVVKLVLIQSCSFYLVNKTIYYYIVFNNDIKLRLDDLRRISNFTNKKHFKLEVLIENIY